MTDSQPTQTPATIASWLAFLTAVVAAAGVAVYIPLSREHDARLFHDLKVELPLVTQAMLQVPDAAFVAGGVLMAATAVAAQWARRRRGGATAVHLVVALVGVVLFAAYRETVLAAFQAFAGYVIHAVG